MIINNILDRRVEKKIPIWFMRQAGRYLPEYLKLRQSEPNFMEFCFNRDLVVESTMQPIRRFGFDAAILFSDILTIPHLMGQVVHFEKGHGPKLSTFNKGILEKKVQKGRYQVVLDSVTDLRQKLSNQTSLLGFSGAPWTLATYMIEEGKSQDFAKIKNFANCRDQTLKKLISVLVEQVSNILIWQLQAGADAVQIFDSWAGSLNQYDREVYCLEPLREIISIVRSVVPGARIIYFAKGVSQDYKKIDDLNIAFGVDQHTDIFSLVKDLKPDTPIQGNLCPEKLAQGDFEGDILKLCTLAGRRPFIFNLGHGILPHTPIGRVTRSLELVRGYRDCG